MIKQRNIALCIVFSIITFGIYALYWFVCLTNDANQESGQTDATSGGVALLLTIVTCNIYGWFWAYKMGEKIDAIKTKNGQPAGNLTHQQMLQAVITASSSRRRQRNTEHGSDTEIKKKCDN